jgi:DNA-binding GntR family transcriptional regulator
MKAGERLVSGKRLAGTPKGNNTQLVPAYARIVNTVSDRIASGHYEPGSRLPSESRFCAEFGVSPMTLRRSLNILIARGLIVTEKGKGTFVRPVVLKDSIFKLEDLAGEFFDESVEMRLLGASTMRADQKVAMKLSVPEGERVVHLRRLALKHKKPAMYHVEYVLYDPRRPLVESQLQLTTLDGFLETARGRSFPRGTIKLRAVAMRPEDAVVLGDPSGSPALCLEHLFEDAERRPVSWGWFLMRADMFELRAHLGPQ